LAASLALAAPAVADPGCPGADSVVGAQDAGAIAEPTLCLLNAERRAAGLRRVAGQPKLTVAAARFSAQMVRERFFDHRAPGGPDLTGRLTLARYLGRWTTPWIVGENLAWARGSAATPRSIVAQWMASPGHRRNILEPAFRDIGIGVAGGSPGDPGEGVTVTTDFGARWLGGDRRRGVRSRFFSLPIHTQPLVRGAPTRTRARAGAPNPQGE
jgi:uncharacterized protein YkwD